MHSHTWDCGGSEWDGCPYPTSNVRVITPFDIHADMAIALANGRLRYETDQELAGKELIERLNKLAEETDRASSWVCPSCSLDITGPTWGRQRTCYYCYLDAHANQDWSL